LAQLYIEEYYMLQGLQVIINTMKWVGHIERSEVHYKIGKEL